MTIPRKFHFCCTWRHDQDAVYWIKRKRKHRIWVSNFDRRSLMLLLCTIQCLLTTSSTLLPEMDKKYFSRACLHHDPHPGLSFAVADKCSSSNSRSSEPDRVPGNRDEIVITQNAEMKSHKMMLRLKLRLLFSARSISESLAYLKKQFFRTRCRWRVFRKQNENWNKAK